MNRISFFLFLLEFVNSSIQQYQVQLHNITNIIQLPCLIIWVENVLLLPTLNKNESSYVLQYRKNWTTHSLVYLETYDKAQQQKLFYFNEFYILPCRFFERNIANFQAKTNIGPYQNDINTRKRMQCVCLAT